MRNHSKTKGSARAVPALGTAAARTRTPAWISAALVAMTAAAASPSPAVRAQDLVAPTEARTPEEERAAFRLPPGFEAQLVASEPDIRKPLNLNFDDRGRLWVTDTVEYPYPAPDGRPGRDSIKILSDFDENGRARSIVTFADGLNIPIGLLPTRGGAIAHSIPYIHKFEDLDDDGRADRTSVLYGSIGFRDTHGMASNFRRGFDGWIYACHGFANDSEIRDASGSSIRLNSGNTFRMREDGSRVEQITHGQVNPFGLTFDPFGDLYSSDCHSQPIYLLMRGAFYPSFGKPHDGLGFCPELTTNDHGSTGIAGVSYYAADHFPEEWRDTVFIGNPVTSRVNHDRFEWRGSTPTVVRQPDFLVSEDPWFRPVDIRLGPDGALYVADFYNRIIGHYEVPLEHPGRDRERGRVWRVVYKGVDGNHPAPRAPRLDFRAAASAELAGDLSHPNLEVRFRATDELAARGDEGAAAARGALRAAETSPEGRAHALWTLRRLDALDDAELEAAARDPEAVVRTHAAGVLREAAEWTDALRALALALLSDESPRARRAAAAAFAEHPNPAHVRPLLAALSNADPEDRLLIHNLRIALRNQLRAENLRETVAGWDSPEDLDRVADVATSIPTAEAAAFLLERLRERGASPARIPDMIRHVARRARTEDFEALAAWIPAAEPENRKRAAELLRALDQGAREGGRAIPDALRAHAAAVVRDLVAVPRDEETRIGTDLANALRLPEFLPDLLALATNPEHPAHRRAWAFVAAAAIDPAGSVEPLAAVVNDRDAFLGLRNHMAQVLGSINLPKAREGLFAALGDAPAELQTNIAGSLAGSRESASELLNAIETGRVSRAVLRDRTVEVRLRASGLPKIDERLAELTRGMPEPGEVYRRLIEERRNVIARVAPDEARGREVFAKNCASCHQIAGEGAKVGPQLDGVGVRGMERLLEDILDPNRNVDQAFRAASLELAGGQVVSGLVLREEGDAIVLADAEGKERRYALGDVVERVVSPLSPMPANFDERIDPEDFARLIHYLLSRREATEAPPAP